MISSPPSCVITCATNTQRGNAPAGRTEGEGCWVFQGTAQRAARLLHVCTCIHQSLLFSPCTAPKSLWPSPPNLTAGLGTQTHRVPASHIRHQKRGEITVRDSPEEENHGVSSPFYQPSENPHVQPLSETLMLLATKASTLQGHRKPGFTSSTAH